MAGSCSRRTLGQVRFFVVASAATQPHLIWWGAVSRSRRTIGEARFFVASAASTPHLIYLLADSHCRRTIGEVILFLSVASAATTPGGGWRIAGGWRFCRLGSNNTSLADSRSRLADSRSRRTIVEVMVFSSPRQQKHLTSSVGWRIAAAGGQ